MKTPKISQPSFKLTSCTEDPIETLFAEWAQSRPTQYPELFDWLEKHRPDSGGVVTANHVKEILANWDLLESGAADHMLVGGKDGIDEAPITRDQVEEVFKKVTAMSIPVSECIHFSWGFTSLPIEWREQSVRKRQWGFWLTSMREFGMDDFVSGGRYAPPVEGAVPEDNGGLEFFHDFMRSVEVAYNKLKHEFGWPQEIARKVIPLCATHNGTMFSNFRTLLDTLSSRGCFIAQVDLWAPVLTGMVSELRKKHPLLGMIVSPPCFDRYSNEYKGCKYKLINENRLTEKDPYAPCPLYCMNEEGASTPFAGVLNPQDTVDQWIRIMEAANVQPQYIQQGKRLLPIWQEIWGRDPFTGELK